MENKGSVDNFVDFWSETDNFLVHKTKKCAISGTKNGYILVISGKSVQRCCVHLNLLNNTDHISVMFILIVWWYD